jgi:uncharacterized protein YuzE
MEFERDLEADAVYIYLSSKPYAYGEDLDDERRVDYASDHTPIGVELLGVSMGVNVENLPYSDQISELLERNDIKIYALASIKQPLPNAFEMLRSSFLGEEGKWLLTEEHTEETTWTSTSPLYATMQR